MTTIESIKRQIQNMREGLPYIDSAVSRLAEQERIKQLESQLKELENAETEKSGDGTVAR